MNSFPDSKWSEFWTKPPKHTSIEWRYVLTHFWLFGILFLFFQPNMFYWCETALNLTFCFSCRTSIATWTTWQNITIFRKSAGLNKVSILVFWKLRYATLMYLRIKSYSWSHKYLVVSCVLFWMSNENHVMILLWNFIKDQTGKFYFCAVS